MVDTSTEQIAEVEPTTSAGQLEIVATPLPTSVVVTPSSEPSVTPPLLSEASPTPVVTPQLSVLPTPSATVPAVPSPPPESTPIVVSSPHPTHSSPQTQTYTVQAGDTLWSIAQREYHDGQWYTRIAQANNIQDANVIQVAQQLTLPPLSTQEKSTLTQEGVITDTAWSDDHTVYKNYAVVPGDTLWHIAERELGSPYRWVELYQINIAVVGSNPDLIYPETVLKIPSDAQPVSMIQPTTVVIGSLLQ